VSAGEKRAKTCKAFETYTGIPGLKRLVQYGRERSTARIVMELDGRLVNLGSPDNLFSQTEFARTVAIATSRMPTHCDRNTWSTLVGTLLQNATDVIEIEAEALSEQLREWIGCGYQEKAVIVDAPADDTLAAGEPYVVGTVLHLTAADLGDHLRREVGEQVSTHALRVALRELGAERETVHFRRGDKSTSRSYYVIETEGL
jgi:hypothetical protein